MELEGERCRAHLALDEQGDNLLCKRFQFGRWERHESSEEGAAGSEEAERAAKWGLALTVSLLVACCLVQGLERGTER